MVDQKQPGEGVRVRKRRREPFSAQLQALADRVVHGGPTDTKGHVQLGFDASNPDINLHLIRGGYVGGCGYQEYAFDIIDGNFLAGYGLKDWYPSESAIIVSNVRYWLSQLGYQGDDKRETILGNRVPGIYSGNLFVPYPSSGFDMCAGGVPATQEFVVSELPDTTSTPGTKSMNYLAPTALLAGLDGDTATVSSLVQTAEGWWNGIGFMDNGAAKSGQFHTRDLTYFLIMVRRLNVSTPLEAEVENLMWKYQSATVGNGFISDYNFDGSIPNGYHSSDESNGLALLAYS